MNIHPTIPPPSYLGKARRSRAATLRDVWMTADEVATYIGCPLAWVEKNSHDVYPAIPRYIITGKAGQRTVIRYSRAEVDAWMESYRDALFEPKPYMTRWEFEAGLKLLDINNYDRMALALGITADDVWAYIQGVEAVPMEVAERLRKIFRMHRKLIPPEIPR